MTVASSTGIKPVRGDADDAAWQHVIVAADEQRPAPFYAIARSTGLSHDKVLAMVGRYHLMKRHGIEPTGSWWHDRVVVKLPVASTAAA